MYLMGYQSVLDFDLPTANLTDPIHIQDKVQSKNNFLWDPSRLKARTCLVLCIEDCSGIKSKRGIVV